MCLYLGFMFSGLSTWDALLTSIRIVIIHTVLYYINISVIKTFNLEIALIFVITSK